MSDLRHRNLTTTNSTFFLDTTSARHDNPHDFSASHRFRGIVLGVACNTFPAGRSNASIQSVRGVATGFAPARAARKFAATAAHRCITCPRRWGRDCGCARARWAHTDRCGGRTDSLLQDLARREQSPAANG